MNAPVLSVEGLRKVYPIRRGLREPRHLVAADDISFTVRPGETLALVGESGSGKSTVGRCLLRLEDIDEGTVTVDGTDISALSRSAMNSLRASVQMVFQDPFASLNPRRRVGELVEEPLIIHNLVPAAERPRRVREMFERVGLHADQIDRYPQQMSGGQLQRVGIARALITNPKLIVLDEPTSALDVTVQVQILTLLKELQQQFQLAYLFISHDLDVIRLMSDRIAVMYLGQIVEIGPAREVLENSFHPYTRALVSATPISHPNEVKSRITLSGEPASPIDPPWHCRLAGRCPYVAPACTSIEATLKDVGGGRATRCIRFQLEHEDGVWAPAPTAAKPFNDHGTIETSHDAQ